MLPIFSLFSFATSKLFKPLFVISLTLIAVLVVSIGFSNNRVMLLPPPTGEGLGLADPIQSVVPPAPNAASLGKYGDIPVSLYTGIPNVSIPLGGVAGKDLAVPISLSYHASGIKVEEVASWVGLGWTLNAGGVVSRTVRGLPDDELNGYLRVPYTIPDMADRMELYNTFISDFNLLRDIADNKKDSQPDLFHFNFNGNSGKFTIDQDGIVHLKNQQKIRIVPKRENDNGKILYFTITTADGTIYTFSETEESTSTTECGDSVSGLSPYTSSWYLSSITPHNRQGQITFSYDPENYTYVTGHSQTQKYTPPYEAHSECSGGGLETIQDCESSIVMKGKRLRKITSSIGQEAEFIPSVNTRDDLLHTHYLSRVELRSNGELVKSYVLSHDYSGSGMYDKRLRLLQVQEFNSEGNSLPPHIFDYNNVSLPKRSSPAIDHWGYYNGKNQNDNTLPPIDIGSEYIEGADRDSHGDYSLAGILEKITYPTGGYSEFEFEPHDYGYVKNDVVNVPVVNNKTKSAELRYPDDPTSEEDLTTATEKTITITVDHSQWVVVGYTLDCVPDPDALIEMDENGPLTETEGGTNTEGICPESNATINVDRMLNVSGTSFKVFSASSQTGVTTATAREVFLDKEDELIVTIMVGSPDDEASVTVYYKEIDWVATDQSVQLVQAGGARIKKISHHSLDNDPIIKTYNYRTQDNPNRSSGVLMTQPIYVYRQQSITPPTDGGANTGFFLCSYWVRKSQSATPLAFTQGSHIGYGFVTENIVNTTGESNGSIEYHYTTKPYDIGTETFPFTPKINYDHRRGLLKKQTTKNAGGDIVQESTYKHEVKNSQTVPALHIGFHYKVTEYITQVPYTCTEEDTADCYEPMTGGIFEFVPDWIPLFGGGNMIGTGNTGSFCCSLAVGTVLLPVYDEYYFEPYEFVSDWVYVSSETNKIYDESGQDFVTTQTTYAYDNPLHLQLTKKTDIHSDGTYTITEMTYPADYGNAIIIDAGPDEDAGSFKQGEEQDQANPDYNNAAYALMKMKHQYHMHAYPVEVKVTGVGASHVLSQYKMYGDPANNVSGAGIQVNAVYDLNCTTTDPAATIQNGAFKVSDPAAYIKYHLDYYPTGNVKEYWRPEGVKTRLEWDATNTLLTARHANPTGTPSLRYEYQYHPKFRQPTYMGLVGGYYNDQAYYLYDDFGRLSIVENGNREVINKYIYHYGGYTADNTFTSTQANSGQNYVSTITMRQSVTVASLSDPNAAVENVVNQIYQTTPSNIPLTYGLESTGYLNGLGGAISSNAFGYSQSFTDWVTTSEYDDFGRVDKTILPAGGGFQEVVYENSPLSRTKVTSAPGVPWAMGSGHTVESYYEVNTDADAVLNYPNTNSGYRPANTLFKTIVNDEEGAETIEFKNTAGQVILQRSFVWDENLQEEVPVDTYYAYTDFGGIASVRTPEGYEYTYHYDCRRRLESKTLANARTESFQYDRHDRMVLHSYGNHHIFTKYDVLGRPIMTGDCVSTAPDDNQDLWETAGGFHGYTSNAYPPQGDIQEVYTVSTYNPAGKIHTIKAKVLNGTNLMPDYLNTVKGYDAYGRENVHIEDNLKGGTNSISRHFNFAGDLMTETQTVTNPADEEDHTITKRYEYDHAGRSRFFYLTVDDEPEKVIAEYQYNDRDFLINRKLDAPAFNAPYLQSINYDYNIRGWMTKINSISDNCSPHTGLDKVLGDIRWPTNNGNSNPVYQAMPENWEDEEESASSNNSCLADLEMNLLEFYQIAQRHFPHTADQEALRAVLQYLQQSQSNKPYFNGLPVGTLPEKQRDTWYELQRLMESNNFQQALPIQVPANTDYRQSYQLSELFTLTKSLAEAKPVSQQGIATKGDRQKGQKGWWNLLAQIDIEQYRMHFHQLALHLYHYANEQCELPIAANLPSNGNAAQTPTKSGATGLFSMHIYYNEQDDITNDLGVVKPLYNGNVAATAWQSVDCEKHGYAYEYDNLRRLTAAHYNTYWNNPDRYSMNASYDRDGNIQHLQRYGVTDYTVINAMGESCEPRMVYPSGYGLIDNLTYSYDTNNNTLQNVTDATDLISNGNDFNGKNGNQATYGYDNGNLISDSGKQLTFSSYSFLDQPETITTPEGRIELTYDALGNKLQKRVYAEGFNPDNGPLNECVAEDLMNQQDYLLDFIYRWHYPETKPNSTEAKFRGHRFYHEEGSIEWRRIDSQDDVAFVPCFQYTIRDHLGNGRVYFTKNYDGDNLLDVLQESHYYPFGAQLEGLSRLYDPPGSVPNASNGYVYTEEEDPTFIEYLQYTHDLKRYNGKEYNRELGLNWYDYGARWYDPVIGRWNAVDPLADIATDKTPYHFVSNNPITRIDPNGLTDYSINNDGKITKVEGTDTKEGPDRLIKGKAKYKKKTGELKSRNFIEVDKGSFDNLESNEDTQVFSMESGENAENIYDFITDGSDIEHEKMKIVTGEGDAETHMFTSYDTKTVEGSTEYLLDMQDKDQKMNLVDITHNHGDPDITIGREASSDPSYEDKYKAAFLTQGRFKHQKILPTFHIRRHGKDYEYKQLGPDQK